VVIMPGGKGTRLDPITRVLPKPLIPIRDKTILELIIKEFYDYGISNFYLTLNYKGSMIEAYFNSIEKQYKVNYIWETDFLGTAGSLKLVEQEIADLFIVSNCDIIVKADYDDVINFHKNHNASLTILSSIQHYKIPYGVIEFKNGGVVNKITEKPEYSMTVNTGVYVFDKSILKYIPKNKIFDMNNLIDSLIANKKTVVTYPVNENDYIDIGQLEEYKKITNNLIV
jgi:NDP-sugar pyrophosphorylase family protein